MRLGNRLQARVAWTGAWWAWSGTSGILRWRRSPAIEMYLPMRQCSDWSSVDLVVRTTRPPKEMAAACWAALRQIAAESFAPRSSGRWSRLVDKAVSPRRFVVTLLGGFAVFALILASLGIYGVISYSVTQRTQEIGIRMALGASAANLQAGILLETLRLAALGMLVGGAASWLLARSAARIAVWRDVDGSGDFSWDAGDACGGGRNRWVCAGLSGVEDRSGGGVAGELIETRTQKSEFRIQGRRWALRACCHFSVQSKFQMVKSEQEYRQDIVDVGKLIYQKGWVAANDGNISIRLDNNKILCTCTGISKGMMTVGDLIICDLDGNKMDGARERTSEIAMHLTIYRMRPDVSSVVHAHPTVATGFAVAGRPLNLALLPEVIIGLGSVPLAEYGLPGTPALTEGMLPYIPKYDAILMGNHGAVSYGEDVYKAFFKMETVEHFARIALVAELLGGPKVLPKDEVDKLFDSRTRYGVKSRTSMEPRSPVVAEDVEPAAERLQITRQELVALVDEALRARGVLA